ncbi:hypothetical protein NHH82_22590 [Oxalobacteraceae bacterium OTU3REALA1]|nr:hypothetical protein NHH82_22590 [Oxalobacteraceae bacterium OTU3REALA1]
MHNHFLRDTLFALYPYSNYNIRMRAFKLAFACLAAMVVWSKAIAGYDDNLVFISDTLGPVNAWRMIPRVLLEKCSLQLPQMTSTMLETYDAWSQKNESLISLIDVSVEKVVPLYASTLSISNSDAKNRIHDFTTQLVIENYFGDKRISDLQICADYGVIVSGLSAPGRVAVVRGQVYSIESTLLDLQRESESLNKAAK